VKRGVDAKGQRTESLVSVSITEGTPVKVGDPVTIYTARPGGPTLNYFDVAPDGRRFLVHVPAAPSAGDSPKLVYVQNWRAGSR